MTNSINAKKAAEKFKRTNSKLSDKSEEQQLGTKRRSTIDRKPIEIEEATLQIPSKGGETLEGPTLEMNAKDFEEAFTLQFEGKKEYESTIEKLNLDIVTKTWGDPKLVVKRTDFIGMPSEILRYISSTHCEIWGEMISIEVPR